MFFSKNIETKSFPFFFTKKAPWLDMGTWTRTRGRKHVNMGLTWASRFMFLMINAKSGKRKGTIFFKVIVPFLLPLLALTIKNMNPEAHVNAMLTCLRPLKKMKKKQTPFRLFGHSSRFDKIKN